MDYKRHYDRLIERARNRVLTGYVESHHVIPRCLGGSDDRENLVQLTAEEHFVSHQLLHKMYPHVSGLAFALISMTGNPHGCRNNKAYAWIRKNVALAKSKDMLKRWQSPEYREKHHAAMAIAMSDPAYAAKMSKIRKGRVKSAEERANIAKAGRLRAPRTFSEEAKARMAEAQRKRWEKAKLTGENLIIGAKTKATRLRNGSYVFSEAHKAAISQGGKGRIPWNKKH